MAFFPKSCFYIFSIYRTINKKFCQFYDTCFINKKFNTELASDLGLPPGRKRIFVSFKVSKTGNIVQIGARGPHPGLEKEAKRVIGLLPKMKPGRQRGKAVVMPFSIPIVFAVQD